MSLTPITCGGKGGAADLPLKKKKRRLPSPTSRAERGKSQDCALPNSSPRIIRRTKGERRPGQAQLSTEAFLALTEQGRRGESTRTSTG